jgi:hypothetical protein
MTVPLAILMALFLPCALLYGHRARQLYGFDGWCFLNASTSLYVRSLYCSSHDLDDFMVLKNLSRFAVHLRV